MPGWSLKIPPSTANDDWFQLRLADAKAAVPSAGFDTISPRQDFWETVTSELVDVVGTAEATPGDDNGGSVVVACGDAVDPSSARFQMTGGPAPPPSHVSDLQAVPWYAAALVRIAPPPSDEMADTVADAIGLFRDADNRVGLGLFVAGSGGSLTNFVGYVVDDSSVTTVLGPAISFESALWHLAEVWNDGLLIHFRFDGVELDDTIDIADVPAVPATMAMTFERPDGEQTILTFEKACVITASPTVGT